MNDSSPSRRRSGRRRPKNSSQRQSNYRSRSSTSHGRGGRRRPYSSSPRRTRELVPAPSTRMSFWQNLISGFRKPPVEAYEMASIEAYEGQELDLVPALFSHYPELLGRVPWVSLRSSVELSAPQRLFRAQHLFGDNLVFMKNEVLDADLISENNARKLEFILAELLRDRPKRLVCFEKLGSSNALAMAFACSYLKIPIEIYLLRDRVSMEAVQDLLDMKAYGAKVELTSSEGSFDLQQKWSRLLAGFRKAAIIPRGGFSIQSVLGYVSAPLELLAQVESSKCPVPDLFIMPVSRGISLVGLEIGRRLAGLDKTRLLGIPSLGHSKLSPLELAELAKKTVEYLNQFLAKKIDSSFSEKDFNFLAVSSDDLRKKRMTRFMQEFMELESSELDLDYSGNALFSLHEMIRDQGVAGQSILFWNSFPGKRNREAPQSDQLKTLPTWLQKEYRELLPSALLSQRRSKNRSKKRAS